MGSKKLKKNFWKRFISSEVVSNRFNFEKFIFNNLNFFFRLAAMFGEKKIKDEFSTVDDIMKAESPRFIKTHLSIELLPKQLWTVKPKVNLEKN